MNTFSAVHSKKTTKTKIVKTFVATAWKLSNSDDQRNTLSCENHQWNSKLHHLIIEKFKVHK
ncbi:CLUMA_CG016738, isoform A [Clunio marinus]|uniref:CLUMA_CG016738, isoform A n=1 Tax=Clunio marinus TaxID=568069 RepID=A0A1J1ITC4_9DIPT|nr:CLUMA_CG016738, isoform A [Clunio marinus]